MNEITFSLEGFASSKMAVVRVNIFDIVSLNIFVKDKLKVKSRRIENNGV